MAEEKKPVPGEEKKPVPWRYRHFVEGVAAEQIAKERGVDPSRMARVFKKDVPEKGIAEIHLVGDVEVVDEVAKGLAHPKRELHKWYIGESEDIEAEREAVLPALEDLFRSIPVPILDDPLTFIKKARQLPLKIEKAVVEGLDEALGPFKPKFFEKKEKGGD